MDKKNPRLVLVVSDFPSVSETFIQNQFSSFVKQGWDVWVYAPRVHGARLKKEHRGRVRQSPPDRPRAFAALLAPLVFLKILCKAPLRTARYLACGLLKKGPSIFVSWYADSGLIELAPDILHFEFGALAAKKTYLKSALGSKIAASFRGYDAYFSGRQEPSFYEGVWKEADGVHCLGNEVWKTVQERGCPPEKFHALIPPAVDTEFFKPPAHRAEGGILRILSVGRLEWKKGYEFALQAMQILKEKGIAFEYRIAGGGRYLEALAFIRHRLDLEKEVIFLGAVDPAGVKRELGKASLFLHAAVTEGFGNAPLEAQAMALPVVASDAGGLVENIENGVTGFTVPRRSAQALAEKIMRLAGDAALRAEMGKRGRERVEKHFRIEEQTAQFEKFYQTLLQGMPKVSS